MPTPRRSIRWILAILLLAVSLPAASVLVAPHAVFIDDRTRTAQVYLINTTSVAEEVEIDLMYGFPTTDSTGTVYVRLVDAPTASDRSAAGWLRVFPRRAVLQPGERQVVRVLAQPPAGLAEGEWWSRMIVTSRAAAAADAEADSSIRVGVSMELRTIISVTYRKGDVRTGVRLTDFRAGIEGDSLVVWVALDREGNAAYLGTLRLSLQDTNNRAVIAWDTPIAVYEPNRRRVALPLDAIPNGTYTAFLRLDTEREDITPEDLVLPAAPVERSTAVEIAR